MELHYIAIIICTLPNIYLIFLLGEFCFANLFIVIL